MTKHIETRRMYTTQPESRVLRGEGTGRTGRI